MKDNGIHSFNPISFREHHQEFDPPEVLRDSIKCFWYDRIVPEKQQTGFEVVPDGYAEIIFHFGKGCSILHNGTLQSLPSPFMMGLLTKPVHFQIIDSLEIIGIRCYPWIVFDLLGLPSGKDGIRTFEHTIALLQPVLKEHIDKGRIKEAITLITHYFLDNPSQANTDNTLTKAGNALKNANGNLPVSQVANAAHATPRTLERKFKQSSGHTVKDISGLMRFEQARNRLWLDPNCNIAGLAHELGYTDQSHLSREFKRYSGTTPAAFARKAKKGHQALSNDFIILSKSETNA